MPTATSVEQSGPVDHVSAVRDQAEAAVEPASGVPGSTRAGRALRRQLQPETPGRPREVAVGDRREALLVLAQGQQQMGDPVGRRQITALADPHAEAMDAMSARAHQDRPLLTDQPDAEPPALQGQPASRRAARARRGRPGRRAGPVPSAPSRVAATTDRLHAPRAAASLQVQHRNRVAEEDRRDGERERLDPDQQRRGQPEGDDERRRSTASRSGPRVLRLLSTRPPPPRHRGGFGEYAASIRP